MQDDVRNPQINFSKIPGGGGVAGALFAISSMAIFLIGVPRLRIFFPAAILLGCGVALILRFVRRDTPGKPWILPAVEGPTKLSPLSDPPRDEGGSLQSSAVIACAFK